MPEFSTIGKRIPMIDAEEKATGSIKYITDLKLPGMLWGKVLRSPHPHARIAHIDVSRSKKLLGVRAAITAEDTPKKKFGVIVKDELPLATDKVRYVGDEVAAVAAIDPDIAEEALNLIRVDYEPLEAVFDPEEAMRPGAPKIHEVQDNVAIKVSYDRGDFEGGLREAYRVFEDRFVTNLQHQAYMEPVASLADFQLGGKLALWLPIQNPAGSRLAISEALDMPIADIRVISAYSGGSFGAKLDRRDYIICALLSKAAGRPVKMVNTRAEDFATTLPRVPLIIYLKTGVKRAGLITAKEVRIVADNGAYTNYAPPIMLAGSQRSDSLYRVKNLRTNAVLVYTNKIASGCFRGFGNPQMMFAVESQMGWIADELGIDPAELRLKNSAQPGDVTAHGWKIKSCALSDCIKKSIDAAGWADKRRSRTPNRGIGMACTMHVSGNRSFFPHFDGSTAHVRINDAGHITVVSGEVDLGQGAKTIFAQIAAEELGVSPHDVEVLSVDTDAAPFGLGTWASRVTFIGGNAVKAAAEDARKKLFEVAARLLEASPEDLSAAEGKIFVRGAPHKAIPFLEAARSAVFTGGGAPILGIGTFIPPETVVADPVTKYGNYAAAFPFAAHVAEVEVDPEVGHVRVLKYTAAHDLGRTLNPMAAEGQVEGGVAQGLGYALTEQLCLEKGKVQNDSLMDYRVPLALDMPSIKTIFVESIDPIGPYGAKGLAEPAVNPCAGAIANAIYDALRVKIKELPITPERLFMALKRLVHRPTGA